MQSLASHIVRDAEICGGEPRMPFKAALFKPRRSSRPLQAAAPLSSRRRSSSRGAHRPSPAAVLPEAAPQRRRPGGRGAAGGGKGRLNFLYSKAQPADLPP